MKGSLSCLRQFLATESPLKRKKNAFYFILKTLFVFEIFTYSSWLFDYIEKRLDKKPNFNVKFLTSQTGQQIIAIHIFPSASRIKGNQSIKLGQLVEYHVRNILLQTSCKE